MAAPTSADLASWISDVDGLNTPSTVQTFQLDEAVAAARGAIEGRCNMPTPPEDDLDADVYPAEIHTAVLILGSRLWERRTAPAGVAGFGDLGVVRFLAQDVDVEALIGPWLKLDGFA